MDTAKVSHELRMRVGVLDETIRGLEQIARSRRLDLRDAIQELRDEMESLDRCIRDLERLDRKRRTRRSKLLSFPEGRRDRGLRAGRSAGSAG